jgi:hypothetical protein
MHAHSSGISFCAHHSPVELVDKIKKEGIDGFVLTNHYLDWYVKEHKCNTYDDFANKFVQEYFLAKQRGDEVGIKVFFGVEVSPTYNPNAHLLIYGIEPEDFIKIGPFYDYSLEKLFSLCNDNGWALVQAHPFRYGPDLQNLDFLHGLEINCHQGYKCTDADKVSDLVLSKPLCITSGGDYHQGERAKCGVYLPDDIVLNKDLANFIRTTKTITLRVQEVGATDFYEKTYNLNR